MIDVAILYFVLACNLIFNKEIIFYGQPIFSQALRLFCSGSLFLLFYTISNKQIPRIRREHIGLLLQTMLFLFCITYSFNIISLGKFSAAQFSFLLNLSPFLAALFSYFYFSEKLNFRKSIGLVIGFIGFLPMLMVGGSSSATHSFISIPGFFAITAMMTYTYGLLTMRQLVDKTSYNSFLINGMSMGLASFCTLLLSFLVESWDPLIFNPKLFFSYLFGLAFVGDLAAFSIFAWLLQRYTVTYVTFAGFLYPIFSALLGWVLLGEEFTWNFVVASLVVFLGLYLFYKEELSQKVS